MSTMHPNKANVTVQSATGNLTASANSTPIRELGPFNYGVIRIDVTNNSVGASGELDFYVQTSFNGGTDWADVENIHYTSTGSAETKLVKIGPPVSSTTDNAVTETDGSLADNTKARVPLGDSVRVKASVTGTATYAYNAEGVFRV